MTTDLAEWASEHGQIIKSGLSENYGGETISNDGEKWVFFEPI